MLNFYAGMTTTSAYAIEVFGSTGSAAGVAVSAFVFGGIIARFFFARFSDVVGLGRMLLSGFVGMVVFSFTYVTVGGYAAFCAVRFLGGFSFGLGNNAAITVVTGVIPPQNRGRGLGYFTLSAFVGAAVGPLVGILISANAGQSAVFLFMAIMPLVGIVLMWMIRDQIGLLSSPALTPEKGELLKDGQDTDQPAKGIDRYVERRILPIAVVCFLIYNCFSSMISFAALYAASLGAAWAGACIFVVYSIFVICTRPFVGAMFDRYGANTVIVPGIAIVSAGFFALGMSSSGVMILLGGALIGIGLGAFQTGTLAAAAGLVPFHRMGVATSTYFIALDASSVTGPVIAGFLIIHAGYGNMYLVFSALAAVCLPLYKALFGRNASRRLKTSPSME